jgi:transposase
MPTDRTRNCAARVNRSRNPPRHDVVNICGSQLVDGRSPRHVAKEFGISWRTVRKYVEEAVPIRKESAARSRPVWEKVSARVETLLAESGQWTGGKQQLTATRLHELLVAEGLRVGVTLVKEAVAERKRRHREVFVPRRIAPATSPRSISSRYSSISVGRGARRGCF